MIINEYFHAHLMFWNSCVLWHRIRMAYVKCKGMCSWNMARRLSKIWTIYKHSYAYVPFPQSLWHILKFWCKLCKLNHPIFMPCEILSIITFLSHLYWFDILINTIFNSNRPSLLCLYPTHWPIGKPSMTMRSR